MWCFWMFDYVEKLHEIWKKVLYWTFHKCEVLQVEGNVNIIFGGC